MGKDKRRRSRHRKKKMVGEKMSSSSSEESDSSTDFKRKRKRPKRPSIIPEDAPPDVGNDDLYPAPETRFKDWDAHILANLEHQRDLGLSEPDKERWDKALDEMMSLRRVYNERRRTGREDLEVPGIMTDKSVQTNEVGNLSAFVPRVEFADAAVQTEMEVNESNSGNVKVSGRMSIWVDDISDEEEVDVKPQLPGECNLNLGAQVRLEGVNHAAVGDKDDRNRPVAEGSRRQNALSSQNEEANQGKSGMSVPPMSGPWTSRQVPETEVAHSSRSHNVIHPEFFERLQLSCRTLGHRSAVFCVLFDVTGKFVFTGADDKLVKIWSAVDGRLLATLRGASSEISDLAVNQGNTLLAAGGWDKLIHVWYLRTCAPVTVLNVHSRTITTLFFCPIPRSRHSVAYLASTSSDGSCSFWGFTENQETGQIEFQPRPTHFQERIRPGPAKMICSSFSPGGIFMAAGSADNNVRVYHMLGQEGPERILEAEFHTDRVNSISWAHEGLRFISGSADGTALVWRFQSGEWRHVRLFCAKILESNIVPQKGMKRRIDVRRVAWNTDDTLVLTAVSDNLVKVWNPLNGELIRILDWHNAFTRGQDFVIESHPFNPRIIFSAGYDGEIIISDIGTLNKEEKGKIVFQHHNRLNQGQGRGGGAVYDCKWAPDGLSLAATDSRGHLLLFTTQKKADSKFAKLPEELFFHTDYKPLKEDAITNEVLDEQTQVSPHLMPPPFLVDMEGNPYPPDLQRLVPGREECRKEQLIPKVVVGDGGVQVVSVDLSNYGFPERNVIMPLSKEELAKTEEERLRFADKEETVYKANISRRPASSPSEYESVDMPSEEDRSDDDITTSSSSSSSSDSDSDPEWVGSKRGEENRNNRVAAEGSRKSTRKSNVVSPQSEGANQQKDSDGEPQPGPSSASKSPLKPKSVSTKPMQEKVSRCWNGLEDIPPQFRPSKWLAELTPKRTPYFPQLGDEVVYYRQGHQNYVAEVEKQKLYEINGEQKKLFPYIAYPDLEASVPARVMKVEFEIKPPRVVTIQLTLLERYTAEYSGPNLSVTYHDMTNVADFIILRQIHDKYIRQDWNVGDRFRCLIPDSYNSSNWWVGTIASIEANRNFPDSKFLCYNVLWDNTETDKLSPWDLDVIPDSFHIPLEGQAIPVSEEDQRIGLYQASPADWPPHGDQNAQCAKLSRLIQQVMSLRVSEAFLIPVDLNRYPEYASQIEYPMDLSTIKARLDNRFYRRVDSLKFDVQYISRNPIRFHGEDSDIGKNAKIVTDLCNEVITNPDFVDVNPVYHQIVQRHWKEAQKYKTNKRSSICVSSASTPRSASKSASTSQPQPSTSRSSLRNINKPTGAGTDDSDDEEDARDWIDRCRDLLELIYQTKDAVPFREPVNPEEYPDYLQYIETPMDLQSVIEDLSEGNYNSPIDFHKDMNLIFSNSRRYNTDKSSQIYGMTKRLQAVYENQVQPILTSYRHDKKDKSFSTPSKSQKKRIMPTRASSMALTPRKNSVKNASPRSPYFLAESRTSSDDEHEGGNRSYFTKASHHKLETSSSRQSRTRKISTASSTSNRSMNDHSPRNGRTNRKR